MFFKNFHLLKKVLKMLLKIAEIENSAIANCENGKRCIDTLPIVEYHHIYEIEKVLSYKFE